MHIKYPHHIRRKAKFLALGMLSIAASFAVGTQSVGEVQPFTLIEAGSTEKAGDVDGSGVVDLQDVIMILEFSQGYAVATPQELAADPIRDGKFTADDALRVLSTLTLQ